MEKVSYTMEIPKESKEVIDLLEGVAKKIKEGSDVQDYLSLIGELSAALDGVDKLPAEVQSEGRDEIAAYLVHKVLPVLAPVKAEA